MDDVIVQCKTLVVFEYGLREYAIIQFCFIAFPQVGWAIVQRPILQNNFIPNKVVNIFQLMDGDSIF